MSGFFDTNVLVYAFVAEDPRQATALELLSLGGEISVQSLNEFVSVARRKLKMDWEEVRTSLASIESLCGPVRPLTSLTHHQALSVAHDHRLHIYDALIVVAAQEAGCKVLWSENMADGHRIGGLTIRNPFRASS